MIEILNPVLASYNNGGYKVEVYSDGTKIRTTIDASIAPKFPEQFDLKITNWCDAGCAWCHEKSTPAGLHGDLDATIELLSVLPAGVEVAIGGGDPLSHPDFERFVLSIRDFGLLPSVTVNGKHFDRHRQILEKLTSTGKLFGVGFSYADALPDWDYEHLVLHLIAGIHSPSVLDFASKNYKILLLGYKKFGRGKKLFDLMPIDVQTNLDRWYRELFWVANEHHISFDNLAIDQIKPARLFSNKLKYEQQWMGPEGEFSMYIDAVNQEYALSSYSAQRNTWTNLKEMFANIRLSQGF